MVILTIILTCLILLVLILGYKHYRYIKNKELTHVVDKLKSVEAQFINAEKMAVIGQLAAGLAHEINNPLSYIIANQHYLNKYLNLNRDLNQYYAELLIRVNENNHENIQSLIENIRDFVQKNELELMSNTIKEVMQETDEGLAKIKKIIDDLSSVANTTETQKKLLDLNDCIEIAIEIVWVEIKNKCLLRKKLKLLPKIFGYESELTNVFVNLLLNAGQAIKDKGQVSILSFQEHHNIVVKIIDSGIGISDAEIENLFTPFYTTKIPGKNTGLGLAASFGIIEQHGGTIKIDSELNKGTTVTVTFPVTSL